MKSGSRKLHKNLRKAMTRCFFIQISKRILISNLGHKVGGLYSKVGCNKFEPPLLA
jgi:hypothetical protein